MTTPPTPQATHSEKEGAKSVLIAVLAIVCIPIVIVISFVGMNAAYWQGFSEGEVSVACAPNDGNLPDLLKCYQERTICEEVLAAKYGKSRSPAKNLQEWNGVSVKDDERGIFWPYTCDYFPSEYGC